MKIEVCSGQNCKAYGADDLVTELKNCGIAFEETECRSLCPHAPLLFVNKRAKLKVKVSDITKLEQ